MSNQDGVWGIKRRKSKGKYLQHNKMWVQTLGLETSEKNVNEPDWANSSKRKKRKKKEKKRTKLNIK